MIISMKLGSRVLMILAILFLRMPDSFAQTGFSGRWSTDPPPKGWSGWSVAGIPAVSQTASSQNPPPSKSTLPAQAAVSNNSQGAADDSSASNRGVLLDLKVEGDKVTGYLGQNGVWGEVLKIELGTIEGETIRFLTRRTPFGREPIVYQWVAELTDDNTMTLRGGNIAGGRGGEGRVLQPGAQPAPLPTTLPPLGRSSFLPANTLRRVN